MIFDFIVGCVIALIGLILVINNAVLHSFIEHWMLATIGVGTFLIGLGIIITTLRGDGGFT